MHHKRNKYSAEIERSEELTFVREVWEGLLEEVTFKLKPGEECSRQMGDSEIDGFKKLNIMQCITMCNDMMFLGM